MSMHVENMAARRRGFTLMELLVVITIIVILVALIIPSMGHLKRQSQKAAARAQLNALQLAIAQYHQDFNRYPASSPVYGGIPAGRGDVMLAQALTGFLPVTIDGAGPTSDPQYGFRENTNSAMMGGKIFGPYVTLDPKQFKNESPTVQYFIDPWGKEILYYRSNHPVQRPAITVNKIFKNAASVTAASSAYFITDDCANGVSGPRPDPAIAPGPFFALLGSTSNDVGGPVLGSDSYLLISAGPDMTYFTADDVVAAKQ